MATYNRDNLSLECESITDLLGYIEQSPEDAPIDLGRYRFSIVIDGQVKGKIYSNSSWRQVERYAPVTRTLRIREGIDAIPDPNCAWYVTLNGTVQWFDHGYLVNEQRLGMTVQNFGRLVYHHQRTFTIGNDIELEQWFARKLSGLKGWALPVPLVPFDPEPYLHQLMPMHHAKFLLRRIKATPPSKEKPNEM
jgi:hypothetical protein